MIADLKPYAEYKESGLPWLGQVPGHWEVRRTKAILREVDRRSTTGSEPLLSLRMQSGLVDHHALGGKLISPSALVGYKRVFPGEIVMNRMRAAAGLFAAATSDGLVSPDYAIFRPACQMSVAYAVLLFRTPAMTSVFRLESRGLGTGEAGFLRLYSDRFGMLAVPFPSPAEQATIVRFLDWANGRLERAIRAKRKVIALLNEQKQAIIHRAVTRGLDPAVPLKPSGIPWLGEIPQHWEVQRLKRVCRVEGGYAFPSSAFGDTGIPVVRMNNLRRGILNLSGAARIPEDEFVQAFSLKAGDILYGLSGSIGATGSLGNYAVVGESDLPAMLNQRVARFVPRLDRVEPKFLIQLIQTSIFYGQVLADTTGTAQFNVSTNDIENVAFALPSGGEQERIVSRIGENAAPLITAISRLEREIELLREYRTRLVADVVTGKLDVREAARQLPVEAVEQEVAPDTEELSEPELEEIEL